MSAASTKEQAAKRARELHDQIAHHRKCYYVDDAPEISDAEYDRFERELAGIEERFPELRTADSPSLRVGGEPAEGFATFRHSVPLLSLDNAYDDRELREWEGRLLKALDLERVRYVVEPKMDGLSIAVHYRDAVLEGGVTRGDGTVGEDVTPNVRTIRSIPLRLLQPVPAVEARGEVFLPRERFERLNRERVAAEDQPFANPRNAAAGQLRRLDSRVTAGIGLDCYFYDLSDRSEGLPETHEEGLRSLRDLGLRTNPLNRACDDLKALLV